MYWLFIVLLLALIAAGYYVYQRLLLMEREIRADQLDLVDEADDRTLESPSQSADREQAVQEDNEDEPEAPVAAELSGRVLQLIAQQPGLAQTELYQNFPLAARRELQKLLRELAKQGQLRREKQGNSYRLYPS